MSKTNKDTSRKLSSLKHSFTEDMELLSIAPKLVKLTELTIHKTRILSLKSRKLSIILKR